MGRRGPRQVVHRLKQAGLALRVGAYDQRRAGNNLGLEADVVAYVGQGEVLEEHGRMDSSTPIGPAGQKASEGPKALAVDA